MVLPERGVIIMQLVKSGLISAPLEVPVTKTTNKKFILNLNNYRNTHFQVLNKAKQVYKELISHSILNLPEFSKVHIEFVLYPKTNRKTDLDNVCSVHAKFFQDALVELGKLPDDTYDYVKGISYKFGFVDKGNPRVDIIVTEVD